MKHEEKQPQDEMHREVEAASAPPKETEDYKDKYFRALAEIENTRKRLQREKIESQTFAIQNVVVDFLQPLDHFEQALKHLQKAPPEVSNWLKGFEMILAQFKQVLQDNGITSFESVGCHFDPQLHEAIETEESDTHPNGTILEEFLRGYKMAHRTIRPAKVKVSVTPSLTPQNGEEAEIDGDIVNGA